MVLGSSHQGICLDSLSVISDGVSHLKVCVLLAPSTEHD